MRKDERVNLLVKFKAEDLECFLYPIRLYEVQIKVEDDEPSLIFQLMAKQEAVVSGEGEEEEEEEE